MTERRYNDKNGSRNPRNRGASSKRFDGKTSEQRRNERAQRSHDGMKRGGGGVSKRNKSGHERNRKQLSSRDFSATAPSQRSRSADPARLVAFEVLNAVAQNDSYANLVLPGMIRAHHLDHRDAGFATELTYGTCVAKAPTTPFWRIARIVRWRKSVQPRWLYCVWAFISS